MNRARRTSAVIRCRLALGLLASSIAATGIRTAAEPPPQDAVTAIIDAFASHRIVALNEEHGGERGHAFRAALVSDPRFAAVANDIVVEFGNSRYQDVADRFVRGEEVADAELRRVWQDTTQPHTIWDTPIYEDFFRVVRRVNLQLARERRLRVLLGDPPVRWEEIGSAEDLQKLRSSRTRHPADVILRHVLPQGRRALVVYGAGHLWRQHTGGANLIEHVERDGATRAFVVVSHPAANIEVLGAREGSWPVRTLALTKGTQLERQVDAVLYLGPAAGRTLSRLSRSLCRDPRYRATRAARMMLAGDRDAVQELARQCADAQ